jgi:hypothetical protein
MGDALSGGDWGWTTGFIIDWIGRYVQKIKKKQKSTRN